jgi:hypothetical protein
LRYRVAGKAAASVVCWGRGEEEERDERKEAAFQKTSSPLSKGGKE